MRKKVLKEEEINEINLEEKTCKEKFEEILEKIKKMTDAIELHEKVKKAVSKEEVDYNYLKYVENSIEDKLFCDANISEVLPKVLIEHICPDLKKIKNFDAKKLEIQNIGHHFEEKENYIDKICVYDGNLISVFGIKESDPSNIIKYEPRKFTRVDMIIAISKQYKEGQKIQLFQYDEYYICVEEDRMKVFTERKVTALAKIQETVFDKIKAKFSDIFTLNKKKTGPVLNLVYDTNPNRFDEIKVDSKISAKSRMKALLKNERKITRDTTI